MFVRLLFVMLMFFGSDLALADDNGNQNQNQNQNQGETAEQKLAAALARQKELEDENARLKGKGKKRKEDDDEDDSDDEDDDDLRGKARKQKETAERTAAQTKDIERALGFNHVIDDFVTKNASLLPASVSQIVKLAHKETYDNAIAKASALKAAIIQEYFGVQSNLDALTPGQRTTLDDYLKLTKTGKEQKAADVYENIFEPALETIRKVKKAEEVGRGRAGFATSSDANDAYKDKLVRMSRKSHLGEKES